MLPHDKRKMLLTKKQELLQKIEFYERRIALERQKNVETVYFDEDYDDSDSDPGFKTESKLYIQSESHLENVSRQLSICVQATQELTGLEIIEAKEEALVETPDLETSGLPSEPGDWSEVMAECRVNRLHFSMAFYVHRPHRKFSAPSFHSMCVKIIKSAHEKELEGSVLRHVKTPSLVVQLIRSYAAAVRSRRDTLSKLHERFGDRISLEAVPTGGYLLQCAGLLQLTWTLECNKYKLATFQHAINCDLEYIEPRPLKLISASHKKLRNPSLSCEERTLLVSDIISTCLEVAGIAESSAQDTDMDNTVQSDMIPEPEVMAPPRQIPKRAKSKSLTRRETGSAKRNNEDTRETERQDRKRKVDTENSGEVKDIAKENQKRLTTNDKKKASQKEIEQIQDIGSKQVPVKKPKALKDKSNIDKNMLASEMQTDKVNNAKNDGRNQAKNVDKEKKITKNGDREKTQAENVENEPKNGVNEQKIVKDTDKNKVTKGVDIVKNKDTKQKVAVESSKDIVSTKTSDKQSRSNDVQENKDKNKQKTEKIVENSDKQENKLTNQEKKPNTEKKHTGKPKKSSTHSEKPTNVAIIQNKPQADKTKSVATSKNTDLTKKTAKSENKMTEDAKKKVLKLTDKSKQSKDTVFSKIPKPLHTKIPVKIADKHIKSKELTPKSKSSIIKPKLKNNQNKLHLNTKPVSIITKAVKRELAVTSTPINTARLAKKSSVKKS